MGFHLISTAFYCHCRIVRSVHGKIYDADLNNSEFLDLWKIQNLPIFFNAN